VSATEYIANFFLVIIGFAVSEILKGSARLIRERRRIHFYWPYVLVIPFAFEIMIFWFLHVFTVVVGPGDAVWSTPDVALICLQVIPWAFISYLFFPSRITDGFDLKKFYFENARIIIMIVTGLSVLVTADMIRTGNMPGLVIQLLTLVINVLVIVYFERLHLLWLLLTFLMANYFMFVVKPISIS
jgi:hypothetical protein